MNVIIIYVCVVLSLFVIGGIIEKYVIPHLSPDNKFKIWWKNNIIDEYEDDYRDRGPR